jgi:hypothetical protein
MQRWPDLLRLVCVAPGERADAASSRVQSAADDPEQRERIAMAWDDVLAALSHARTRLAVRRPRRPMPRLAARPTQGALDEGTLWTQAPERPRVDATT